MRLTAGQYDCDQTPCDGSIHVCKGADGGGRRLGMEREKSCHLFRDNEGGLDAKRNISYCQIDGNRTDCMEDVSFCEKPDAFREYFRRRLDEYKRRGEEKE